MKLHIMTAAGVLALLSAGAEAAPASPRDVASPRSNADSPRINSPNILIARQNSNEVVPTRRPIPAATPPAIPAPQATPTAPPPPPPVPTVPPMPTIPPVPRIPQPRTSQTQSVPTPPPAAPAPDPYAKLPATGVVAGNPSCKGDASGPFAPELIPCRCPPSADDLKEYLRSQSISLPQGDDYDANIGRLQLTMRAVQAYQCPVGATYLRWKSDALLNRKKDLGSVSNEEVRAIMSQPAQDFKPILTGGAGPGI
ncbi:hypothetical protein DFS34DRAFT_651567 [Phlyctochytrium arcticum]|nr:hypothetical protein DFS34DRAFT_448853 [Phlyctochytrium arcticum]KAI9095236.1 hypothetical protein DFS34DRAFT_651567 [Phlyctochytrium arcticum]